MNEDNQIDSEQVIQEIDTALSGAEPSGADKPESREGLGKVAASLRLLGAVTLIGSALTFMVQQWDDVGHIVRYFHFLGFTVLLSIAGFLCGLRIREDKSARTLLAIAAAVIPVHFCQLGALVYSVWPYKEAGIRYPSYLFWSAPDPSSAVLTSVVGIAVIIPICLVSFLVLARSEAWRLSAVYLAGNALLLLPFRNPDLVALLALGLTSAMVRLENTVFSVTPAMKTRESSYIRLMLWAPLLTLVGRELHLYPTTALFIASIFAITACLLIFFVPTHYKKEGDVELARCLGLVPLLFALWYLSIDLKQRFAMDEMYQMPLAFASYAAILFALSFQHPRQGLIYRHSAVAALLLAGLAQMMSFPGVFSSVFCLIGAILGITYGLCFQSKPLLFAAWLNFGYGILYHLYRAFKLYGISPWLSLALLGLAVVVGSSLVERYQTVLGAKLKALRDSMEKVSPLP